MNRIGFMTQLAALLQDVPVEERREAMQYYNDYFDDDDSDADYSDNDSIVEYEEAAKESDITESTSEIQSNSDDLEEYLDD